MASIYFITGTDTGVGKTVLTTLLIRHLRDTGTRALAVKPFCSGGREDARLLRQAQADEVALEAINPWHFRVPLTPLLAARRENRKIGQAEVLRYLRSAARQCDVLLIEGAGGLLSPLGEGFDARDLIVALQARPIIVSPNRLGALNQVRLVLAALTPSARGASKIVLMQTGGNNLAARTNGPLLAEFLPARRLATMPRLAWPAVLGRPRLPRALGSTLGCLLAQN
jgi:dethiobiotin synthetase